MVVFFDIDGTIVDDRTQIIPPSAVRAVEELGRRGHLAVVNTGRPFGHIDPRVRDMAFGAWVCGCGMELYFRGTCLRRRMPDRALCREVVRLVRECGMSALYEAPEGLYWDGAASLGPEEVREAERMKAKGFRVAELGSLPEPVFMKWITHDLPGCRREAFLARMERDFTCIDRGNTMVEYVLRGCSKAEGMEALLSHLGISREETLAIGDSTNDLPMFSVAAHTVCMGGGMEELKRRAEYVTAGVLDDGVERALRHFGLLE